MLSMPAPRERKRGVYSDRRAMTPWPYLRSTVSSAVGIAKGGVADYPATGYPEPCMRRRTACSAAAKPGFGPPRVTP